MVNFRAKDFLGTTSNSLRSKDFKISVVNYTHKVSEEWHFHEKVHISGILQGGNLESRKRRDIQVSPGKVMVYNQGEIHRNRFTAHPSKNLNIELDEHFFSDGICFSNLALDEHSNMELLRIYFELVLNDSCSIDSCNEILKSLFWVDKSEGKGEWVSKAKTVLKDRWNEFVPLQELSKELQVHPITISKYFSKYVGMTLSDYMRRIKVRRAAHMLLNSSSSIAEIAFTCGFSDQSHMTRLIKNYLRTTPVMIRSLALG